MRGTAKRLKNPAPDDPRPAIFARGAVPIPNSLLDQWLPRAPHRYFAVLLLVLRKTVGFRKCRDFIALSQITAGAGVSRQTARRALRFWQQNGILRCTGRCGIRGVRQWEVCLEPKAWIGTQPEAEPGPSGARVCARSSTGARREPRPGLAGTPQQIESQIEKDKGQPNPSETWDAILGKNDKDLKSHLKSVQEILANNRPRLARSEIERIEMGIRRMQEELSGARRNSRVLAGNG